ncbi:MAG: S8 family serine peptidase [Myxococcota bacterium]
MTRQRPNPKNSRFLALTLAVGWIAACAPGADHPEVAVSFGPVATAFVDAPRAATPTRRPNFRISAGQLAPPVQVRGRDRDVLAIPGEVIVRLRQDADLDVWRDLVASLDAEIVYESPRSGAILVRGTDPEGTEGLLEALLASPLIRDASANAAAFGTGKSKSSYNRWDDTSSKTSTTTSGSYSSDDAFASFLSGLASFFSYASAGFGSYQNGDDPRWDSSKVDFSQLPASGPGLAAMFPYQWNLKRQFAREAWAQGTKFGKDVRVAVLDSGVMPVTSLPAARIQKGANFIELGGAMRDGNGHGTHMASLIAGADLVTGFAPAATILPVRVLDDALVGSELALIEGLYFAASDPSVKVVNMSLTFPRGYFPSALMTEAIDFVNHLGIVMVAAAGNDDSHTVGYPARFPEVIAVGAYKLAKVSGGAIGAAQASYSNSGGSLDVAAFGGDLTTDLDADKIPDGILGERPAGSAQGAGLFLTSGTSPAAAQVSGAAALLISEGAAPTSIRPLLQQSAFRGFSYGNFTVSDGCGLLNVGFAMEALRAGATKAVPAPLFASAALAFVPSIFTKGNIVPQAVVQISRADGTPVSNADVYVHFGGVSDDHQKARTNSQGVAVVGSMQSVAPTAGFVTVTVDAVTQDSGRDVTRPTGAIEVDRLSYELASNFGTGLASSALVVSYTASTWTGLISDPSRVLPSYNLRTLGTGFTSSAIVFGFTPEWYVASKLAASTLLFRSTGAGLPGSPLTFDQDLFRDTRIAADGGKQLTVRNYTVGSGLASSAIIFNGKALSYDAFFTGTTARIFLSSTGAGFISSAIVWDGSKLLRTSLSNGTAITIPTTATADLGTAVGSRTATYGSSVVTALGQSWSSVNAMYPKGSGFISSALVSLYDPYRYAATYSGYALNTRTFQATSDAVVKFVKP